MNRLLSKSTFLAALLLLMAGTASAQSVTIAWDPNKEADLAGYVVHYGTASGVYTHSLDVGKVTSANIVSLTTGKTYFFAVQAYSTKALMSPMSAELKVTDRLDDDTDSAATDNASAATTAAAPAAVEVPDDAWC